MKTDSIFITLADCKVEISMKGWVRKVREDGLRNMYLKHIFTHEEIQTLQAIKTFGNCFMIKWNDKSINAKFESIDQILLY